jgi:hypothetical protein
MKFCDKMDALYKKATEGPWQARFLYRSAQCVRKFARADGLMLGTPEAQDWPDAECTAESHNALPAMLKAIRAAEEYIERHPNSIGLSALRKSLADLEGL